MTRLPPPLLLVASGVLFSSLPSQAALNFYDPFDEAVTVSPNQPSNWTAVEGSGDHGYVASGSLSYGGYAPSIGNSFGLGSGTEDYERDFTDVVIGDNESVYMSFLLRLNAPLDSFDSGSFRMGTTNGSVGLVVGWGTSDHTTNQMGFSVSDRNKTFGNPVDGDNARTAETYDIAGVTYLVVAGYNRGTSHSDSSVSIWINPDETSFGASSQPTPDLTLADIASWTHSSMDTWTEVTYRSNGSGSSPAGGFQVDEFRVGTTWGDVVPIPEPSSIGLVMPGAVGFLGLVLRRYRK